METDKLRGLKEAAEAVGTTPFRLLELVDAGAISPSVVERKDGNIWHKETVVAFSADDIEEARAEIDRRKFPHVFEQHGYVVEPDAKFYFGPGWEGVLRSALTALSAIPGPPRVTGGKEKFGAMVLHVSHDWTHTDDIKAIRETYRARSLATCEECGEPGELRKDFGHWQTCCDRHARRPADVENNRL